MYKVDKIKMINIVYLYTEIMPYQMVVYKELAKLGYNLHVVYLDHRRLTPFEPPILDNMKYYPKSGFTRISLLNFVIEHDPVILVVAGWVDKDYLHVSRYFMKNKKSIVVCPMDTQFTFRLKQIGGILFSKIFIRPYFSFIWVPGFRQYWFAKLLGYPDKRIIFNSYTGDIQTFNTTSLEYKKTKYPKNFLFVGRYSIEKGLDILLDVWGQIEDKKGWTLTLVGNGPLKEKIAIVDDVTVLNFADQKQLVEYSQASGCFVLPSTYEPWAMVIHEFSASGLPIICSDSCGASTFFVEHGYNGFIYETEKPERLKFYMQKVMNMQVEDLLLMSERSKSISGRVTPELSAFSLLSVLDR